MFPLELTVLTETVHLREYNYGIAKGIANLTNNYELLDLCFPLKCVSLQQNIIISDWC